MAAILCCFCGCGCYSLKMGLLPFFWVIWLKAIVLMACILNGGGIRKFMKSKKKRFSLLVKVEFPNAEKKWLYWPYWAENLDQAVSMALDEAKSMNLKITDFSFTPRGVNK